MLRTGRDIMMARRARLAAERVADLGEEVRDLTLQEDHGADDDDGDEGDDQRVLDQALPRELVLGHEQTIERLGKLHHGNFLLLVVLSAINHWRADIPWLVASLA